jgi:hypothetical protein
MHFGDGNVRVLIRVLVLIDDCPIAANLGRWSGYCAWLLRSRGRRLESDWTRVIRNLGDIKPSNY